ncbi:MAG: RNA polymerase sigma factor [Gammaproteobacteria bacterium]|nr:RNA polymerase sigma factor [Gammaproteobacteria bacterium]
MAYPTDKALVSRILDGDEAAFRQVFDEFFPRLYRFAKARLNGDHDAACDVVQQTFCKAIERLDSYRGEAALYTWFCQICRNTLIDYCRSNNVRTRHLVPLEDHTNIRTVLERLTAPAGDQPEAQATRKDVIRLIQATLDVLPVHYGDVLELKYVEGLSVREIATHTSCSEKATESTLTRARAAFREAFADMAELDEVLAHAKAFGN